MSQSFVPYQIAAIFCWIFIQCAAAQDKPPAALVPEQTTAQSGQQPAAGKQPPQHPHDMQGMQGMQHMEGMQHGGQTHAGMDSSGMFLMNESSGTGFQPSSWPMPMLMSRAGSW